ncbi:MAG: cytochrome c-type biogenesis protein CcmH [Anaerolineaceae bacterium]|nr:cytochrome c-type biogenesis protein CcmH [Anaerolineaceae bacterium]
MKTLHYRNIISVSAACLFALAAFLLCTGQARAQTPQPVQPGAATPISDDQVNSVAHQLYCPVCENIPLDVCPTQACAQWRELIRTKLSQGWSPQQIRDYFVQQYGDRVLSTPPERGLNLLVYILPPVFFLLGVFILYRVLRSMRRRSALAAQVSDPPSPVLNDPYRQRLEEELKEREIHGH